jgi:hypothetical protein
MAEIGGALFARIQKQLLVPESTRVVEVKSTTDTCRLTRAARRSCADISTRRQLTLRLASLGLARRDRNLAASAGCKGE